MDDNSCNIGKNEQLNSFIKLDSFAILNMSSCWFFRVPPCLVILLSWLTHVSGCSVGYVSLVTDLKIETGRKNATPRHRVRLQLTLGAGCIPKELWREMEVEEVKAMITTGE